MTQRHSLEEASLRNVQLREVFEECTEEKKNDAHGDMWEMQVTTIYREIQSRSLTQLVRKK